MLDSEIKGIKYYEKLKTLECFNKLRYLYKLHITDFFNNNIQSIESIATNAKKKEGTGLLIIDITKINPQKIDCLYYPLDKIPHELNYFKKKIIEENNNKLLYFYIINRKTTMFLTK